MFSTLGSNRSIWTKLGKMSSGVGRIRGCGGRDGGDVMLYRRSLPGLEVAGINSFANVR